MPVATSRQKTANSILFRAHLSAKRFKEMVASAKAISDQIVIEVDSGNDERAMRYWAIDDAKPRIAMVGLVQNAMFEAYDGDDEPHTFQVPTKHLMQCVSAFNLKLAVEVRLTQEDSRYVLTLRQSQDDESEPNERTLTVIPSDSKPTSPVTPEGAVATVNLVQLNKVLNGQKQYSDVVMVSIRPDEFGVAASTKRLQDGWKQACEAMGNASGLFATDFLKKATGGAKEASSQGEIHLSDDHPLRIVATAEDLVAQYYVASREVMK